VTTDNALGEFLRARRGLLLPGEVGLPAAGPRRVEGLRREEVAVLAGTSVDYYTRLEQGRERGPSAQVLDAISRALDLDLDALGHLFRLAGVVLPAGRTAHTRGAVSPALLQWMDGIATPAFVVGRALDVLACNCSAEELFSPFTRDNLAEMVFLDPAGASFYVPWQRAAQSVVAHLREAVAYDPRDPRIVELLAALRTAGDPFVDLWERHDVRGKSRDAKTLRHPDAGALELTYQAFDVRDSPGQQLVTYHAEPGSDSARSLTLLGTLAASRRTTGNEVTPTR
jgi:transcriptional regulator with XRE-family HTH domain